MGYSSGLCISFCVKFLLNSNPATYSAAALVGDTPANMVSALGRFQFLDVLRETFDSLLHLGNAAGLRARHTRFSRNTIVSAIRAQPQTSASLQGEGTPLFQGSRTLIMVVETERDGRTWYECELCGLMLNDADEARRHEGNCDGEEPDYYQ